MAPTWSFITVSYNSSRTLKQFWHGVLPAGVEWIVVDNASTDDSVAIAESLGARVIPLARNSGFSAANNHGIKVASGRYLGFVNPDVTIDWTTLAPLAESIDRSGGLVAPQLVNTDGSLQPNGRGVPLLAHKIMSRLGRGAQDVGYHVLAEENESRYVFWAIGAVILGSASTVRTIGGWNERFFLYYEDKDICIRSWKAGVPVILDGSARWTHGWARETKTFRLKPWIREFRAMATFYSLYPELLLGGRAVEKKHHRASKASGRKLSTTS